MNVLHFVRGPQILQISKRHMKILGNISVTCVNVGCRSAKSSRLGDLTPGILAALR
jgi:hypothetical protein